jgi:hypothetical protein
MQIIIFVLYQVYLVLVPFVVIMYLYTVQFADIFLSMCSAFRCLGHDAQTLRFSSLGIAVACIVRKRNLVTPKHLRNYKT